MPKEKRPVCYPPLWLAIIGLTVGEAGNFAAFGLASPTVISPLGAVAVIANALIAFFILKEEFRWRNAIGLFLTVCGSVIVVLNAPPAIADLTVESFLALIFALPASVYFVVIIPTIILLALFEPALAPNYLLVDVTLCSLLGSITVLAAAAVSKFIGLIKEQPSILISPVFYLTIPVLLSTAVLQMKYLNEAQKYHDSSKVVPVYYIVFTVCSISGSGIVYQDFWGFKTRTALGFISGCIMCFFGVYLITKRGAVATEYDQVEEKASRRPSKRPTRSSSTMLNPRSRKASETPTTTHLGTLPPRALSASFVTEKEQPQEVPAVDCLSRAPDSPMVNDTEWLWGTNNNNPNSPEGVEDYAMDNTEPANGWGGLNEEGHDETKRRGSAERTGFGRFISSQLDRGISGIADEGSSSLVGSRRGSDRRGSHRRQLSLDLSKPQTGLSFVPGGTLIRSRSFGSASSRRMLPQWMRDETDRLSVTMQ